MPSAINLKIIYKMGWFIACIYLFKQFSVLLYFLKSLFVVVESKKLFTIGIYFTSEIWVGIWTSISIIIKDIAFVD